MNKKILLTTLVFVFIFCSAEISYNDLRIENEKLKQENVLLKEKINQLEKKIQEFKKADLQPILNLISRSELKKRLKGKTSKEIIKILGIPEKNAEGGGTKFFEYHKPITQDDVTGEIDREVDIYFDEENDVVLRVDFIN